MSRTIGDLRNDSSGTPQLSVCFIWNLFSRGMRAASNTASERVRYSLTALSRGAEMDLQGKLFKELVGRIPRRGGNNFGLKVERRSGYFLHSARHTPSEFVKLCR